MNILLDTNILLRSIQPASLHYQAATDSLRMLNRRGDRLCVVPQNLYEFWAVSTRLVAENGLGFSTIQTQAEVARIRSLFALLPDAPALLPEWEGLVVQYDCKGKNSHDARLVAAMKLHAMDAILTFNERDFARYLGILCSLPPRYCKSEIG